MRTMTPMMPTPNAMATIRPEVVRLSSRLRQTGLPLLSSMQITPGAQVAEGMTVSLQFTFLRETISHASVVTMLVTEHSSLLVVLAPVWLWAVIPDLVEVSVAVAVVGVEVFSVVGVEAVVGVDVVLASVVLTSVVLTSVVLGEVVVFFSVVDFSVFLLVVCFAEVVDLSSSSTNPTCLFRSSS